MKIATWNVNSLRVRLPQVVDWLRAQRPDVLALQETKCPDADFPTLEIEEAGYHAVYAGEKTYNGVALLTRAKAVDVEENLPGAPDQARRFICATVDGLRVASVYVPNGSEVGSEKYAYKLDWFRALAAWTGAELRRHEWLVVLGDFNVAPEDRDVHDPEAWREQVLCSTPEREALRAVIDAGLVDALRAVDDSAGVYSWWDYRMNAFKRDRGLRIDHILVSTALAGSITACAVDRAPRALERPSDHAPVWLEVLP